jgi:class 3 adenylate cyclase
VDFTSNCTLAKWGRSPARSYSLIILQRYGMLVFSAFGKALVEAERRQVTVLFTDMVGFTSFSERSGEEAAFTLMQSLSKLMSEAVREQGGVVQSFTGDGIMAVFGAPVAFEDAPLRACRAALSILQKLKTAKADLEAKHGLRPQLRIGLNTGPAVVGQVEGGADAAVTVLGDTVNFTSRLQSLAEPDSVFMSEATHRSVQGMVEATFTGEHTIKGKSEPQKAYRLDTVRQGATRFEAAVSRGLGAFIGRERELEMLERGLAEARSRSVSLTSQPSRAWASHASYTSSASASARTVPLSYQEAAHPTASRRRSFPSSKWCAVRSALAPANPRMTLRKN